MKKYFKLILFLVLSIILLAGCFNESVVPENDLNQPGTEDNSDNQNSSEESVAGKGTLKIYMTDTSEGYKDPPDFIGGPPELNVPTNSDEQYLEVNISISRIEGHIAGDGDGEEGEGEEGEDEGYWEELEEWDGEGYKVDLMKLNDVSVLLASLNLEPNSYTQLRVFLDEEAELVFLRDSSKVTEPLKIPSSAQTGIKLNHPFEIVADNITKLTIEFEANESVVKLGNGEYLMKPVIGLSSETYSTGDDLTDLVASVFGTVSHYYVSDGGVLTLEGIDGAGIELIGGAYMFENNTTTSSEGSFILENVPEGIYTLNVDADGYDIYSETVEVIAGEDTPVDIVLSSGGISGVVKEDGSETEVFINGAEVKVDLTGENSYSSTVYTDENGEFIIESLPVGFYNLMISATGYETYTDTAETIQVISGTITDVGEISLTPTS